jgi:exopolysaccharide biosynthesis polyprenyl glycosylphosphotransferase
VLGARAIAYAVIRRLRRLGVLVEPTLVVGAGAVGASLALALQEHAEYGLVPVGFLDSCASAALPLPVLGDVGALPRVVEQYDIRRVIIAFGPTQSAELIAGLRDCVDRRILMYVLPRLFELGSGPEGRRSDEIWGLPLVLVQRPIHNVKVWRIKRVFDICVATVSLVLLSPLLLALAVAVRLSSAGPVIFRQVRVGQHGRPFELLKFRSMRVNDDSDTTWTVNGDTRRTKVGVFLRRTSLDELPQLFNVLRGDMSLVGPRPERPHFVQEFGQTVPHYGARHRVPVGLTGWAQVHGLRGDSSIAERTRFDNQYIECWSPWKDLVILARTITAASRGS